MFVMFGLELVSVHKNTMCVVFTKGFKYTRKSTQYSRSTKAAEPERKS